MVNKPASFHDVPPTSEIETPNKAVLEVSVAEALGSDASLDGSCIEVTSVGDTIVLSGSVQQQREVLRATDIALSIAGVREVVNRIVAGEPG